MKALMEKLDPKVITSAGGILLAAMAMWGILRLADNRVADLAISTSQNTAAIAELAKAIQSNTEVLRQLITNRLDTARADSR